VDYYYGFFVYSCNGCDESISAVPRIKVEAVAYCSFNSDIAFTRIGIDEDNSCCSSAGCRCAGRGGVSRGRYKSCTVSCGLNFDRIEGSYQILSHHERSPAFHDLHTYREIRSATSPTHSQGPSVATAVSA
jgi:hypothetical protein